MKSIRLLNKASYHQEDVDSDGSWALSYGDMITLLLSFFVIFFSTDFKGQKVEKLNRHLSFQLEGAVSAPASQPLDAAEMKQANMSHPGHAPATPEVDLSIGGMQIKTHPVGENVVVTFQAVSFYGSGKVTLEPQGEALLREFAQKYLPYAGNYRLAVKGFTDKRPVVYRAERLKKFDDNLELSALRSLAAMRILQQQGIPLNRMEIAGAGELELIDRIMPRQEGLTQKELDAFSRTIVLVVQPVKESW